MKGRILNLVLSFIVVLPCLSFGKAQVYAVESVSEQVIIDFTDASYVKSLGFNYSRAYSKDGLGALEYSGRNLTKSLSLKCIRDWTAYNIIDIELYCANSSDDVIKFAVMQENPSTSGIDYYCRDIELIKSGVWKHIQFGYYEDGLDHGELVKVRSPLGYGNVTSVDFMPAYGNNKISDGTVFYIKRIKLISSPDGYNSNGDYILSSRKQNISVRPDYLIRGSGMKNIHPRLLADKTELEKSISLVKSGENKFLNETLKYVVSQSEKALTKPDSEYSLPDGLRLVNSEREMIRYLTAAYVFTGDKRYFDRCMRAINVAASWDDWNDKKHFLCTAEMAYSFALAYDLLYEDLSSEQKQIIRNALVKNAISPALEAWRGKVHPSNAKSNWQQVCSGGIGLACLAIAEEDGYGNMCSEMISLIQNTIPKGINEYAPEGAYPEGLSYWRFSSRYLFNYINALKTSCRIDFKLPEMSGLDKTGYFPVVSRGSGGVFNFSDMNKGTASSRAGFMFYLSELYGDPFFASYAEYSDEYGDFEDLLSYRSIEGTRPDWYNALDLDYVYTDDDQLMFMRSSWNDTDAAFVGVKGGSNNASHGDLDIGQFVYDRFGTRWLCDPGSDNYNGEGYWDMGIGGKRWTYWRKRAEAHNTLVIDPSDSEDQYAFAESNITKHKSTQYGVYAVLDITSAYHGTKSVKRGISLTNNRKDLVICDELDTNGKKADVYQFYVTEQSVSIDPDDSSVAYLSDKNGNRLKMEIMSPEIGFWSIMGSDPITVPNNPDGYDNSSFKRLAVRLENAVNPTISVYISSAADKEAHKPYFLADFDNYLKNNDAVCTVYNNGTVITDGYYTDGTLEARFDFDNCIAREFKLSAVIAHYDKFGKMISADFESKVIASYENGSFKCETKISSSSGDYVKIMFFDDADTLHPYIKSSVLKYSQGG